MEKRVLFTELDDRGSHLRKEITPTAVVSDKRRFPTGLFWDANKTYDVIVADATSASDTLEKAEKNLNNEIARATNAETALSNRIDDLLGIDALDIEDLKQIVEDLDPETGILSVIDLKADQEDLDLLKDDISVETPAEDANGYDYVEIGGIKWATKNVGAENITDYGKYFAWGETTGYTAELVGVDKNFTSDDYELPSQTKYNWNDNKTVLDSIDDAAAVNMGGSWRMPTALEWQTLLSAINFIDYNGNVIVGNNKHTTLNGVTGIYIADKTDNLKRLFFPTSGFASSGSIWHGGMFDREYSCNYWTSTLDDMYENAYDFYSDEYMVSASGESNSRQVGLVIRGVLGTTTQKVLGTTILDSERTDWNSKVDQADLNQLIDDISVTQGGDANGHEYVDLGLPSGTVWATMNVGASGETDYGNYYMYGKGATLYNGSDSIYTGIENPLSSTVDTASVVMGGDWHMPTQTLMLELINNTTYTWTTINGVNGGKFTAQNGNYIFIPAAGKFRYSSSDVGMEGGIWGSTPNGSSESYELFFYPIDKGVYSYERYYGLSIRGVLDSAPAKTLGKTVLSTEKAAWNAKSDFSGSYTDLTNKPTIPSIWTGTQQEYDLIDPIDPSTIYIIK